MIEQACDFFQSSHERAAECELGKLFAEAGFVDKESIEKIVCSNNLGIRMGQMLILSGLICHDELQAALQIQSLLREQCMARELAIEALKIVREQSVTLDRALEILKIDDCTSNVSNNRLGQLLLDASLISDDELQEGLKMAQATGLPLGKIFVLAGILDEDALHTLIQFQILLRQGAIGRRKAVSQIATLNPTRIKETEERYNSSSNSSNEGPVSGVADEVQRKPKEVVTPEGLLVQSGIISEAQYVLAIQECAIRGKSPEELLVERGIIDTRTARAARAFAEEIDASEREIATAVSELCDLHQQYQQSMRQQRNAAQEQPGLQWFLVPQSAQYQEQRNVPQHPDAPQDSGEHSPGGYPQALPQCYPQNLAEFLVLCNVITREQCNTARKMCCGTKMDEIAVLIRINSLSAFDADVAAICYQALHDSVITIDEAIWSHHIFREAVAAGAMSLEDIQLAASNKADFQTIAKQLKKIARTDQPQDGPAPLGNAAMQTQYLF